MLLQLEAAAAQPHPVLYTVRRSLQQRASVVVYPNPKPKLLLYILDRTDMCLPKPCHKTAAFCSKQEQRLALLQAPLGHCWVPSVQQHASCVTHSDVTAICLMSCGSSSSLLQFKSQLLVLGCTILLQDHCLLVGWKGTVAAASKARAASWQCPVACRLQPACSGEGWWLKGFSATGTMCISEVMLPPIKQSMWVFCKLLLLTSIAAT